MTAANATIEGVLNNEGKTNGRYRHEGVSPRRLSSV